MTEKTAKKPRIKGIAPLKKFMKVIPKYYESLNSGLENFIEEYKAKYDVDLAYERDITTLFKCLDTVAQNTSFLISIRIGAICTSFDQILFSYDFKENAPKSVQKQFKHYTDYMQPTDRLIGELKEFICEQPFKMIEYEYSYNIAEENEKTKDFFGDTVFWVLQK